MAQIIHQIVMMTYTTIFHQLCQHYIQKTICNVTRPRNPMLSYVLNLLHISEIKCVE